MDWHDTPFCSVCGDYYYVRDRRGRLRACPRCACKRCERLLATHPDLGGCICHESKEAGQRVTANPASLKVKKGV